MNVKLRRAHKIALGVAGGVLLLVLVVAQSLSGLVDADAALAPLRKHVQELTGQPLITERIEVSVFPTPKLVIHGVAIRNDTQAQEPYLLFAKQLTISMSLSELLFDENAPVRGIHLSGLELYLERDARGHRNWGGVDKATQKASQFDGIAISYDQASFRYVDLQNPFELSLMQASGQLDLAQNQLALQSNGMLMGQAITLAGNCRVARFNHFNSFDADCTGNVSGEGLALQLTQRVVAHEAALQTRGDITFDTQDIRLWGDALFSQKQQALQRYLNKPMPLKLAAQTYRDSARKVINITEFALGNSRGKLGWQIADAAPEPAKITLQGAFEQLDFDEIKAAIAPVADGSTDMLAFENGWSRQIQGDVNLAVAQLNYNALPISNVRVQGLLYDGLLDIAQASGDVPGQGRFLSIGQLETSSAGVQYKGVVEASGQQFSALLPLIDQAPTGLLAAPMSNYRARMNVQLSPAESILSELRLVVGGNVRVAGGATIAGAKPHKVTGAFTIENADMNQLAKHWLVGKSLLDAPAAQTGYQPFAFTWLKTLDWDATLKLNMPRLQLAEFNQNQVAATLRMAPNQLALEDLQLRLDDVSIAGSVALSHKANAARAFVKSDLHVSQIKLGDALRDAIWANGQQDQAAQRFDNSVWSKRNLNFNPLRYFDGEHLLRVGNVQHRDFTATNLQARLQVQDTRLSASMLNANLWGGDLNATFELDASALPQLRASYSLARGNAQKMLASWVDYTNLNGLVALTGNLQTGGVTFSSWVDAMQGAVSFDARGVVARYFNVAGIVRSLRVMRNVASVSGAVRAGLERGAARFDRANGVMTLGGGKLNITNFNVTSNEATGTLQGAFDLRQWQADLQLRLALNGLGVANPPSLVAFFDGDLSMPTRRLDLKPIESFVVKSN